MKKITIIILSTLSAYNYALDLNANAGTLGVGVNLSQEISKNLELNSGIHYIALNNMTIGSADVSNALGTVHYSNTINVSNTALNLGLNYNFFNHEYAKIGVEAGLIYNNYAFNNEQKYTVSSHFVGNLSGSLTDNTLTMNKIAPYMQLNTKTYFTDSLYLSSSLGFEVANLKMAGSYSNTNYINIPVLPILQIGLGYSF